MNSKKNLNLILLALTLLRLRAATQFGQTVDEAHYVLYGRFLDWSYFDHPPLVGWVQYVFQYLPVDQLLQARLPAIIISLWTSQLIFNYLVRKNVSVEHSAWAVLALNLTPMFNTMSIALLPDTLLMPLTVIILNMTDKVLAHSTFKNWLSLGFFLGLAGLAKYTAVLYVIALVILFIYKKKQAEILKPQIWGGILVALALISPVLYWNYLHDFISFKYQSDHVSTLDSAVFKNLINSFAIQFFSWGLGPFIAALGVHAILLFNLKSLKAGLSAMIYLCVFLAFFIYVSISEVLLPHWMLIYFIMAVPIAYAHLLERKMAIHWLAWGGALSGLLSLSLLLETAFKVFPTEKTATLYEGVAGWQELLMEANEKLSSLPATQKGLAVMNWTLGSRAMYYNKSDAKVFVVDKRIDQFDIWNPQTPQGFDLIVMIEADKKEEHLAHLSCDSLTEIGDKITKIKNIPVNHFLYYHCANYLAYK